MSRKRCIAKSNGVQLWEHQLHDNNGRLVAQTWTIKFGVLVSNPFETLAGAHKFFEEAAQLAGHK